MLKNIRCFIVFIVILVLDSFRIQEIVFHFSPENMKLKRLNNLPFNAVKPNFVATSFTEIISS